MKKQRKSFRYITRATALMLLVAFLFSMVAPFMLTQTAKASGETYVLYYPDDDAVKTKLREAYDKSGSDKFNNPAMENVSILAHGGTLFGDTPQRLVYDRDVNKQLNARDGDNDHDGKNQYFTRVYYCNAKTGDRSYSTPSGLDAYYRITYAVALTDMTDADKLFKIGTHKETAVGATKIIKITPDQPQGIGKPPIVRPPETIKELDSGAKYFSGDEGPQKLDDDIDKINPAACRPSPVGEDKISVKNYYIDASAKDKEIVKPLLAAADAAGANAGDGGDTQSDCNATISPISWIICPIVDIGSNLSDFVFKDIVSPLLKDVPISTDPDDEGFIAWQNFRLLGNILLVGSLLSIVYSQAKGGK